MARAALTRTIKPQPIPAGAEQFMVPMRDGVRLATDVYLPPNPTRHPAVMIRTPYDKASRYTGLFAQAKFYNENGYVLIAQDVRGKFRSEGATVPYEFDVQDAYDTIDWIVTQSWSDGSVGLTGASYYGYTAWAGVASGHPAVRAAIPRVTGIDMGSNHVGSLWSQRVPRLTGFNDLVQIWTNNDDYLIDADYAAGSLLELLEEMEGIVGGKSHGMSGLLARAKSRDYHNPYGARHPYYTTDVPILHWVNWYDPGLAPAAMIDWRRFRGNPSRRDLHYLRAGSADHGEFALADVGRGDERNPYMNDATQREMLASLCGDSIAFFDEHIRGIRPAVPTPRARWHVGHDGWHSSEDWTPDHVRTEQYFLSAATGRNGAISKIRNTSVVNLDWVHDPANPVPSSTTIENIWRFLAAYPDERDFAARQDVLTFTSAPQRQALTIAGQPILRAVVLSSAPSMHLFATLQDVFPDGTTRPISHGLMVTSATKGEALVLAMDDIAYQFRPGHKVQLQIRSSNFPWYLIHPGTNENPWFATNRISARQTLRTGGTTGASLELPVLAGALE